MIYLAYKDNSLGFQELYNLYIATNTNIYKILATIRLLKEYYPE